MSKKVLVEGEAVFRDGNDRDIRFYTEEFILDASVLSLAQARSIIQKGLLTDRLRKMDNFKNWRTCQVVTFEDTTEVAETSDLDKLLLKATQMGCIPENFDNYRRSDHKIKALEKAIEAAEKRTVAKPKFEEQDLGYID